MNGPTVTPVAPVGSPQDSLVDKLLRSLEPHHVVVTRVDELRAYLEKYPDIIPHILPTVERARREFGEQAELLMSINDDPEIYDPFVKMLTSAYLTTVRTQCHALIKFVNHCGRTSFATWKGISW